MTYKRIMVPLNGMDDAAQALRLAFDIGQRFEAEVIGLHAAFETSGALPYMGESMSGALLDNMVAAMEKEASGRQKAAQAALDKAREAVSGRGKLVVQRGVEEDVLAQHGRLADLLVVARGASDIALSESPTMQAAIMETGRPVLVAPPTPVEPVGRNGRCYARPTRSPWCASMKAPARDRRSAMQSTIWPPTVARPRRFSRPAATVRSAMRCCWRPTSRRLI